MMRPQANLRARCAHIENYGEPPRRHIAQSRNLSKRNPPILAHVDVAHWATKTMRFVIADEAVNQSAPCHQLHFGIEGTTYRENTLIELLLPVTLAERAPNLFGKEASGKGVWRKNPRIDAKWLGLGFLSILARDEAVFDHTVDNPVAAFDRALPL